MTRGRERRPAWVGAVTFVVLAAAWYALTTLTHTIGSGRFPSPGEAWDALRQITVAGYADAIVIRHHERGAALDPVQQDVIRV